ncbi:efflux transporter outer membrane subunit [Edaphobacter sp. HDX4]|uniref:efflux transporter outer membrane subunit n=1 Tax=Edaphobacter sp. HDX4 TaxID=2794064 RepID=UPI002FE5944D
MNCGFKQLLGLAGLLAITGCKVGPNYKRPILNTPANYRGGLAPDVAALTPANATPLGAEKYTAVFTDPMLQQLIAEALKNNYDVKIAADRVLEEQAAVGVTRAGQFPTLTGGASYNTLSLPGGLLSGLTNNNSSSSSSNSSSSNKRSNTYIGGFTASAAWNLDFWGYYRRMTEAQRAEFRATQWAQQTTYSTIIEDVATDYYQLRSLDAQLAITRKTLDARKQSLDLTNKLFQGGSDSLADVRQAEELYYTAQAQIPDLLREIEQAENNLGLLLGRNPGSIARDITASQDLLANAPHPVDVPVGLPSDLLERRPDIRRAEELLVQANANIGVAKAQFFPTLSLSATGGTASSQLKKVVDSDNIYVYAAGSLSQPIFDAGKIRNNYKEAKARDQELLHTYQQTIASALKDVSNALVGYSRSREYREQQEKQTSAAADALRLARMRYQAGSTSYLEVLTTDANLYSAQLTLASVQQQEALALVQLYNALGGGW